MSNDPLTGFRDEPPLRPEAVVIQSFAHNGKPCRIVDNTGTVPRAELEALLQTLVKDRRFGIGGMSASGGNTISIGGPVGTHVQLGGTLYRILLFPYEARIERF